MNIRFRKTGKEIKTAISNRRVQLEQRLQQRNASLDSFLEDKPKVRSYLVRSTQPDYGHRSGGYVLYGLSLKNSSSGFGKNAAQQCNLPL